jgi:hypothetical protein
MNKLTILRCLQILFAVTCVSFASAQGALPSSQPNRLTIIREQVKVGQGAAHAKHEAGWPAAFAKANSPDTYIALTSLTGANEAWYLVPWESHAAEAASMKRFDSNPVLSAELERLSQGDAEFITGITTIQLMARRDLSLGAFPNIAKVRYFEISVFSVRQGQEANFDSIIKTYGEVRKRVSPDASYRFYAVNAGMPDPTYFVMSSVSDYGEFDRTAAEHQKVFESTTPEESAVFAKWGEAVMKSETNRFRLDPGMSYVLKEVRESDPDFWMPK